MRPHPPYKLLAEIFVQTIDLSHRDVTGRVGALNVNPVAVVDNAVKDGVGQRAVIPSELLVPAFSMELRAENRGGFLPPAGAGAQRYPSAPAWWASREATRPE